MSLVLSQLTDRPHGQPKEDHNIDEKNPEGPDHKRAGRSPNRLLRKRTVAALSSVILGTLGVSAGTADAQTTTVGVHPWGVAVDSKTGYVYVTNEGSNTVSVLTASGALFGTVNLNVDPPFGVDPQGVAVDSETNTVYVTNFTGDSVSVIKGALGPTQPAALERTVRLGSSAIDPDSVAVNDTTGLVYIGGYMSSNVLVYRSGAYFSLTPVLTIPLARSNIHDVVVDVVDSKFEMVLGSAYNLNYVASINALNRVTPLPVINGPAGMAVDSANGAWSVAVNWGTAGDKVESYTVANRPLSVAHLAGEPNFVAILAAGGLAFSSVPANGDVAVSSVATGHVLGYVKVGSQPEGIDVNQSTHMVYVADYKSNEVTMFQG